MEFWEYRLTSPALCLGERVKAGLFRPCDTRTIRYSAITGALRQVLSGEIQAAGYILPSASARTQLWVYGPRDRGRGVSKLPLTVQYLANAEGRVYLLRGDHEPPPHLEFSMGALKSHGLGRCQMDLLSMVAPPAVRGRLLTRLPEDIAPLFEISAVAPRRGYLFRPTSATDGVYVRSLLEDSLVDGPSCLVKDTKDA